MRKVGLTGIIGSGKTTAAKYFKKLGIPVFIADESAKKIMNSNSSVKSALIDMLGRSAYENQEINKEYISDKIFNDHELLTSLNNLIHPEVQKDFDTWFKKQKGSYVVYEAALIFENGSESLFDKIICVKTPMELINIRLMKRRNYSKQKINKILDSQLSQELKCSKSDYCIDNITKDQLISQINKIHSNLL